MNIQVQVNGQVYAVEVGDLNSRPIQAMVGGEVFDVWPEEAAEMATADLLPTAPPGPMTPSAAGSGAAPSATGAEIIAAPLPGDIVAVAVRTGDAVTAGQLLCTLESMKMNNPVRSPRPGVVAEVFITVGEHVNHGQPLLRLS
jgi:biotin carboxyl carrier protein